MKITAYVKKYKWKVPVTEIDFKSKEVEVDLTDGNGDTSNFTFDEVKLSVSGDTSDGYHTFDELYHHRMILFSIICNQNKDLAWKSMKHHDGTMYENYFIVGISTPEGDYTYHYDIRDWNYFNVKELEKAPKWDGHNPSDITRLLTLVGERIG